MSSKRLTEAELEALPTGSAILRDGREVFIAADYPHSVRRRLWGTMQSSGCFTSNWIAEVHSTLLWKPPA